MNNLSKRVITSLSLFLLLFFAIFNDYIWLALSILVAIHPGTVKTNFSNKFIKNKDASSPLNASQQIIKTCENLSVSDTGKFFSYNGEHIEW